MGFSENAQEQCTTPGRETKRVCRRVLDGKRSVRIEALFGYALSLPWSAYKGVILNMLNERYCSGFDLCE